MRITPREQEVIKRTAQECFDAAVVVRLFGSRTDDAKKGGDIDLFVQTTLNDPADIARAHIRFLAKLYTEIGEQKIDVLLDYPNRKIQLPIFEIALKQGIVL